MKSLHQKITKLAMLGALFASFNVYAGVTTDAHGNVGYDTAEECDAAVLSGQARFYTPFTHKSPLKRQGEARVVKAQLRDLGSEYARGACDIGVGRRMGRDGVSTVLQGKYIPFSPDMPVNVYTDAAGNALRVTMAKCDNWFSGNAPRAVANVAPAAVNTSNTEDNSISSAIAAPVAAVTGLFAGTKPYVFGTVGALHAGTDATYPGPQNIFGRSNDTDTRVAGQVGFGAQFNDWLGAEVFYTGSDKHKFDTVADLSNTTNTALATAVSSNAISVQQHYKTVTQQHTYGGRFTVGQNLSDKFRLFGKLGVAGTHMKIKDVTGGESSANPAIQAGLDTLHSQVKGKLVNRSGSFARPTVGLGATYKVTDNLAVRGDYDHYFKKDYKHNGYEYTAKGKNYVGVGVQYNFR